MQFLLGTQAVADFFNQRVWEVDRLIYSHGLKLVSDPSPKAPMPRKFPARDVYAFGIALELLRLTNDKKASVAATNYLFYERDVDDPEKVFTHRDTDEPIFLVARPDEWEVGTHHLHAVEHNFIKFFALSGGFATSLWIINATQLFTDIDSALAKMKDAQS